MELLLRNRTGRAPVGVAWVRRLSERTLAAVKGRSFERGAEMSVTWVGDARMRRLNKDYRGKDRTTDVLSFPLLEGKRLAKAPKRPLPLGDVVISLPRTRRQAAERGVPFRDELALLLVHGILHLLGFDHATPAQEKRMFGLQSRILKDRKGR